VLKESGYLGADRDGDQALIDAEIDIAALRCFGV